jgi:hypothetical protein
MWTRFALLIPGILLVTPAWAQAPAAVPAGILPDVALEEPVPAVSRDIYFDQDLLVDRDLMLEGITATETVNFRVPETWSLTADPTLHLRFNHSASLTESRSVLTIWVNGNGAGSVRLGPDNVNDGLLRVRLPRTAFYDEGYNNIQFRVVQHVDDVCEDPFDPAVWTRVQLDSFIRFSYRETDPDTDLLEFPRPYFDARGYGETEFALAGLESVSTSQLDALAILGFGFGRHSAYRGVHIRGPIADPSQASTHVLVVGTPSENPLVGRYIDTSKLRAGVGTIASISNPGNPAKAILVVTGGDAEGVVKAAEALTSQDRYESLSGRIASVREMRDPTPPQTKRVPLPVPPRDTAGGTRFPLSDMRMDDVTVRGFYAPPISIPIHMEGDSEVHIDGARIGLDYAYSSGLDTRLSTLEVRLDDVTLRSVALRDAAGAQKSRLWVDLPHELMQPDTELEVVFHLFPLNFDPCVYITDRHIWGTVFASTELRLARDGYTQLPDLGKLKYDMWPYDAALSDRGGLLIVTPDEANPWDAASVTQLMAQLGTISVTDRPDFAVVRGGSAAADADGRDMIVLVGDSRNRTYTELRDQGVLTQKSDKLDILVNENTDRVLAARVGTPYGTVEQALLSAEGIGRTALVLKAESSPNLLRLVQRIRDPAITSGMTGNVVVVGSGTDVRSMSVATPQTVGTRSVVSTIRRVLQASWAALIVGVIAAAILLALLIRAWAARRGGQA